VVSLGSQVETHFNISITGYLVIWTP